MVLQTSKQSVTRLFSISQKHSGIWVKENWIIDGSIADTQASLHNNNLIRLPYSQYRHSGDDTVGIILCRAVDYNEKYALARYLSFMPFNVKMGLN